MLDSLWNAGFSILNHMLRINYDSFYYRRHLIRLSIELRSNFKMKKFKLINKTKENTPF